MKSPDYFEFFSQAKVMSGSKGLEQLSLELEGMGAERPLILSGEPSLTKGVIKAFYESKISIGAVYDDIPSTATSALAERLAALFAWKECDSIIAVGSDSVMDLAKAVNIAVSLPENILTYMGDDEIPSPLKPFVAVVTADLKGYETTNRATIDRQLYRSDFLYPDIICIDERMMKKQDTESLLDISLVALTQAIEASAEPVNNALNDAYALAGIQGIAEYAPQLLKKGGNKKFLKGFTGAASFAGIAFANAPTGPVHSLGAALAEETGHPEGVLMGIILMSQLERKLAGKEGVRDDLLFALGGFDIMAATAPEEKGRAAVSLLKEFIFNFGAAMPHSLEELHIPRYKMEAAAERAAKTCERKIALKECLAILEDAEQGLGLV